MAHCGCGAAVGGDRRSALGATLSNDGPPAVKLNVAAAPTGDAPTPAAAEPTPTTVAPTTVAPPTTVRRSTTPTTKPKVIVLTGPLGDLPAGTVMEGPITISGTIRNAAMAPISKACVTVQGQVYGHYPLLDFVTGADGRFSVTYTSITWDETAQILVRDCTGAFPGFARRQLDMHVRPLQPTDLQITVVPGSAVEGNALHSPDQTTLPNHCISLYMTDITVDTRTDARGYFRVPDLPVGTYSVEVAKPAPDGSCAMNKRGPNLASSSGTIERPGTIDRVLVFVGAPKPAGG